MDLMDHNPNERNTEIDNLIIAAAAASGEETISASAAVDESVTFEKGEGLSRINQSYWYSGFLQADHVASINQAAREVLAEHDRHFMPEPYNKKYGSEQDYQEMMDLMDFKGGEDESNDRIESLRKFSMIFESTGAHSQALPLYEQSVNEAAYQISILQPAAIFHKRDLAMLAKMAVRMTGFDFPNSRATNYTPVDDYIAASSGGLLGTDDGNQSLKPSTAAPASASMLLQKSGLLAPRRDSTKPRLTAQAYAIIARAAQELAPELPNLPLKSREQCSLVENFVYTDAHRLMTISPEQLDEEMEYIRDVSAIHGRYQSGPRMPNPRLSPYEMGVNEAAACVVKLRPTLLTHTLHLTDWARRVLAHSGLQLSRIPAPPSPSHQHLSQDRWPQRSNVNRTASGQLRLQNSESNLTGSVGGPSYCGEYLGEYGTASSTFGLNQCTESINGDVIDYEASCGLDSCDLIQPLGGPQAIAALSDFHLEKLGKAQFTVVDPRADAEFENCSLGLAIEEGDTPLDVDEILRVTGEESLEKVVELRVPCCGYTSLNCVDISRCTNLRELDLSENALRVFPRRLYLPNLKKLGISGNRFIHLPLVEQFPKLTRLAIDEKLKQLLNPQMLAYFCPKLKMINGQFFDEVCSDFTTRVIQEARAVMEPFIHSKWDNEYADLLQSNPNPEDRHRCIETMIQHMKDNFMLDDAVVPYRNLLAFRIADEYLRSKEHHQLLDSASDAKLAKRERERSTNELTGVLQTEETMPDSIADEDEAAAMLTGSEDTNVHHSTTAVIGDTMVEVHEDDHPLPLSVHYDGGGDGDDDEERESEARTAGERALFNAADELLGVNFPDPLSLQQQQGPPMQMMVVDAMGRMTQQQVFSMTPPGHLQLAGGANGALMQGQPPYQLHLGKSLRAGRSIVMTVVRPSGISGRPVAEFLPGELRNKDYVKGYMASEIYKKTVKETLGQKSTPRKRNGPGRPRKTDATPYGSKSSVSTMVPLGEINPSDLASIKKPMMTPMQTPASSRSNQGAKRSAGSSGALIEDSGASANLPPRPKKRKPLGMHRSLRDLCSEQSYGFTPSYLTPSGALGGMRTDASMLDYDPLHFIRCHAKDNDAGDSETKVWRCLFEPNPMRPEETTHVVATCGGECVCLINCATGKVIKRFKHADEEFYTIAWTTVEVEGNKRTNILAAAGRMREIRLLHPDQLVCYNEMKGHLEDITAMIFHQTQPTILFSGDSKASVLVWDIGVPTGPDYKSRFQLLMRLRCPRLDVNPVLNLVFLPHYAYLIAGCEDGLFAWKITDLRLEKREREPDMELKLDVENEVCIDGLAQLSDNSLVIKVVESGEIMVFDFASVLERRKGLQRIVPIEMRGHLYWSKTDEIYINVSVRQNLGAVICGDNEGAIWIYDLDPYLDDLHSSSRKKFFVKPIKILEWPECSVQGNRDEDQQLKESITSGFRNPVVNSVEMSSDGHFLAAVTDNNLVCIWRYAPPATALTNAVVPSAVRTEGTVVEATVSGLESGAMEAPGAVSGSGEATEVVQPESAVVKAFNAENQSSQYQELEQRPEEEHQQVSQQQKQDEVLTSST